MMLYTHVRTYDTNTNRYTHKLWWYNDFYLVITVLIIISIRLKIRRTIRIYQWWYSDKKNKHDIIRIIDSYENIMQVHTCTYNNTNTHTRTYTNTHSSYINDDYININTHTYTNTNTYKYKKRNRNTDYSNDNDNTMIRWLNIIS